MVRMVAPNNMVVQEHRGRSQGKCLDDSRHLGNSIDLFTRTSKTDPHVIISRPEFNLGLSI